MWDKIELFLNDNLQRVISTGIVIIFVIIILFINRFTLGKLERLKMEKRKRASTVAKLLQSIVKYIAVILSIIIILGIWNFNIGPVLAGAGIIGLAVGFGAQSIIKDLFSGISIVFDNYYDVGDVIEIKGFKGTVIEVGLKSTKIVNWLGDVKIFSNGDITEVTNFSKNPSLGVVEINVAYEENIDKVISLLEENLIHIKETFPQVIEGPNVVGVVSLAPNSVVIRITVTTLAEEHYSVERGIRKYVKELFNQNHIEIPYPRVVMKK